MAANTEEMVLVPASRLAELEAENATLKERLAIRNHNNIARLRQYDSEHPEKKRESTKKYKTEHRAEINARRRELYRLKKAGDGDGQVAAAIAPN